MLAELAVNIMKGASAPNFFTVEVTSADDVRVSITIQRMAHDADSPAAKLARLAKENAELKAQLEARK